MEERFGFLHIPKTGGSSFAAMLRRVYRDEFHIVGVADFSDFPDLLATMPVICGHVPLFLFDAEPTRRRVFTILREPTARVISAYKYIISTPAHFLHRYVVGRGLSLADCIEHPALRFEFANYQVKMLGWLPSEPVSLPACGEARNTPLALEQIRFRFCDADMQMVETAYRRLTTDIDFALSEDEQGRMHLFERVAGQRAGEMVRENVTAECSYIVTDRDHAAITEANQLDAVFYLFARNKLITKLAG